MIKRLRQYWYEIESSFWFVPGLIIIGAVVLALGLTQADVYISHEVFEEWPGLLGAGAASSQSLLETIASSMVTVAGVVFSITLVALSLTSSQYSPRVLRTFMHDRANQVVLGVFIGIFAYCLVILRTIRDSEGQTFVPTLAVLFGLFLGFVGIAFLVFFIHHIAISIQASRILASVFEETVDSVDTMFPEELDGIETTAELAPHTEEASWHAVPASQTGYIQQIDTAPLLAFARENKVMVRLERGIGEFLIEGAPAVSVLDTDPPENTAFLHLNAAFTVGAQRTINQDAGFGIRQIVDVALKGLSPGINDVTTAVMSIDYLTAILVRLANRRIETPYVFENGELRLLYRGPTYNELAGEAFRQIRLNAEGKTDVLARLFVSLEVLAAKTENPDRRQILLEHARDVEETVLRSVDSTSDRRFLKQIAARVIALLDTGEPVTGTSRST